MNLDRTKTTNYFVALSVLVDFVPVFFVPPFLEAFFLLVSVCAKANVAVPITNPRPSIKLKIFFIEVILPCGMGGYGPPPLSSWQSDMKPALTRN
jgi:hypothetical protein